MNVEIVALQGCPAHLLAADGIATPSGRTVHTLHGVSPIARLGVDDSPLVAHLVPLLVGSVQDLGGEVDDRLDEFHVVVLGLQVDPLGERDEPCGGSVLKFISFIHVSTLREIRFP